MKVWQQVFACFRGLQACCFLLSQAIIKSSSRIQAVLFVLQVAPNKCNLQHHAESRIHRLAALAVDGDDPAYAEVNGYRVTDLHISVLYSRHERGSSCLPGKQVRSHSRFPEQRRLRRCCKSLMIRITRAL